MHIIKARLLTDRSIVVVPRCEFQSCREGVQQLANSTCLILPINHSYGGDFLHVLYLLEPFSNIARSSWDWPGHFLERQSSVTRGARAEIGRSTLRNEYLWKCDR